MKKLIAGLILAMTSTAAMAEIPSAELAAKLGAATAQMTMNGRNQCTATKIGHREWLTAGHCVAYGLRLETSSGQFLWPRSITVAVSEKQDGRRVEDWAILHTTNTSPGVPSLDLACGEPIYQGQPIAYFGFPYPTDQAYLEGYVSSVRKVRTRYNHADWVIDVPAAGGVSGSAVVDRNTGQIIGVLTEGVIGDRAAVGFYLTAAESIQNLDICEDWNKALEEWDEEDLDMEDLVSPTPTESNNPDDWT